MNHDALISERWHLDPALLSHAEMASSLPALEVALMFGV